MSGVRPQDATGSIIAALLATTATACYWPFKTKKIFIDNQTGGDVYIHDSGTASATKYIKKIAHGQSLTYSEPVQSISVYSTAAVTLESGLSILAWPVGE